ncbi:MAG: hypothetical protein ACI4C0_04830 [Lachnospiraceae bacterium]
MIDWDEVASAEDADKLKEAKHWLFQENIRIGIERKELEENFDRFQKERAQFKKEMEDLNRRTILERKRLKEESLFFDKKMAILKNGFLQLDADRQEFEKQKRSLAEAQRRIELQDKNRTSYPQDMVQRLFAGINNPLLLRKRYKDLIKIFHPDNLCGDEELVQMINREYARRKSEM